MQCIKYLELGIEQKNKIRKESVSLRSFQFNIIINKFRVKVSAMEGKYISYERLNNKRI